MAEHTAEEEKFMSSITSSFWELSRTAADWLRPLAYSGERRIWRFALQRVTRFLGEELNRAVRAAADEDWGLVTSITVQACEEIVLPPDMWDWRHIARCGEKKADHISGVCLLHCRNVDIDGFDGEEDPEGDEEGAVQEDFTKIYTPMKPPTGTTLHPYDEDGPEVL